MLAGLVPGSLESTRRRNRGPAGRQRPRASRATGDERDLEAALALLKAFVTTPAVPLPLGAL